ncbi:MAG: ABC transporter permease, partial [Clostridia bacterium]|nr:ABC transporter permease [Clostridia bacterium]
ISILERRRELATLRVLGFYDGELAAYLYRENVVLTLLGIAAGVGLGIILHRFVILTCELDIIMFGRAIQPLSYAASVVMTIFFAALVNFGMFFTLRKIDMVESLKSVE